MSVLYSFNVLKRDMNDHGEATQGSELRDDALLVGRHACMQARIVNACSLAVLTPPAVRRSRT